MTKTTSYWAEPDPTFSTCDTVPPPWRVQAQAEGGETRTVCCGVTQEQALACERALSRSEIDDACVEIRIGDDPRRLWMRRRSLERGKGPVMLAPNHDEEGPFGDSYAHLYGDGTIRRYGDVIGQHADIREVAARTSRRANGVERALDVAVRMARELGVTSENVDNRIARKRAEIAELRTRVVRNRMARKANLLLSAVNLVGLEELRAALLEPPSGERPGD